MSILITGVSGVLGQNLFPYLLNKGYKDFILTDISDYDIEPFKKLSKANVQFFKGDIRDKKFIKKIVNKNIDIIIHTAAASPTFSDDIVYSTIINGTKLLLEEAYKEKIKRFIYLSSTSVYGIPKKVPVFETNKPEPFDAYNKSKIKAEELCHEYRKKGMCIPILRPRTFIGPGRLGSFVILFEWAMEGRDFPMIGKGTNRYQFLDVDDLSQAVYLCMIKPEMKVNDTFNIGAKDFKTMKEDYQSVLNVAGFGRKIINFPAKPALMILSILAVFKLSPLYKRLYDKLNRHYFVSISKAEKILGYKPKYSNEQALARNYQWFLQYYLNIKNTEGKGNNVPWKQGALKYAKIFFQKGKQIKGVKAYANKN